MPHILQGVRHLIGQSRIILKNSDAHNAPRKPLHPQHKTQRKATRRQAGSDLRSGLIARNFTIGTPKNQSSRLFTIQQAIAPRRAGSRHTNLLDAVQRTSRNWTDRVTAFICSDRAGRASGLEPCRTAFAGLGELGRHLPLPQRSRRQYRRIPPRCRRKPHPRATVRPITPLIRVLDILLPPRNSKPCIDRTLRLLERAVGALRPEEDRCVSR